MSRQGLIAALLVSLAVNLFVIGGVAGAFLMQFRLHAGPPMGPPRPPLFAMSEEVAAQLTPEHRQQWLNTVRQAAAGAGPRLRQAHELRREAWSRLSADPVNGQAIVAELTQARMLELQARGDIDSRIVNFAGTLPADERKRLADKLSRARVGPRMLMSGQSAGPGPGAGPGSGPGDAAPAPGPALPDR